MSSDGCDIRFVMVEKKFVYYMKPRGRENSFCIATGYGLDCLGIESLWDAKFSTHVQTCPMCNGYRDFPGLKRPGRGADHQATSSAEFTNE
jgi:hypothetical protein